MLTQGYYRCRHSGLLYPGDYVKEWGSTYGIGYGREPRSVDVWDTYYGSPAVAGRDGIKRHPVGPCGAGLDYVERDPDGVKEEELVILDRDDIGGVRRAEIIRQKQLKKSLFVN